MKSEKGYVSPSKLVGEDKDIIVGDVFIRSNHILLMDAKEKKVYTTATYFHKPEKVRRLVSLLMKGKHPKIRAKAIASRILDFEIAEVDASDEIDWSRGKVGYVDVNDLQMPFIITDNIPMIFISDRSINGARLVEDKGSFIQFIGIPSRTPRPKLMMICYRKLSKKEEKALKEKYMVSLRSDDAKGKDVLVVDCRGGMFSSPALIYLPLDSSKISYVGSDNEIVIADKEAISPDALFKVEDRVPCIATIYISNGLIEDIEVKESFNTTEGEKRLVKLMAGLIGKERIIPCMLTKTLHRITILTKGKYYISQPITLSSRYLERILKLLDEGNKQGYCIIGTDIEHLKRTREVDEIYGTDVSWMFFFSSKVVEETLGRKEKYVIRKSEFDDLIRALERIEKARKELLDLLERIEKGEGG